MKMIKVSDILDNSNMRVCISTLEKMLKNEDLDSFIDDMNKISECYNMLTIMLAHRYDISVFPKINKHIKNEETETFLKEALKTKLNTVKQNSEISLSAAVFIYALRYLNSILLTNGSFELRTKKFRKCMDTYFGKNIVKNWMIKE
jgi:hypothetical protein